MTSNRTFSAPARALLVAGAFALVVTVLESAAPILVPILLAVFIAIVVTPILRWMRRRGIPKWAALMVIILILLDVGSLLALVTTGAVEGFRDSLPTYQERFITLSDQFGGWLEGVGASGSREAIPDLLDPNKLAHGVRLFLSNASSIFAMGFLVLLTTIFILLETPTIPAKLRAAFHLTEVGDARLKRLLETINRYMQIKTLTSLGTAFCVWLLLRFFGIDFAILWVVLAFFLNFVPVVGNIVMMIPPVLLALVQIDLQTALLVAVGYLVINTAIGNVLEPRIMGKGLGVSTLAIFISLLFWGWLFGTVGMFLAVPLTAAAVIALDANPHTRPLAILLGPEIAEEAVAVPDAGSASPSDFQPAWWLPGPHAQTLWPALCRRRPRLPLRRERLELPDGDFLDLDWTGGEQGPLVLILHGLEGSSTSHYVLGLLAAITGHGWRGVVMHFRGCGNQPNRLARGYCAGDTRDIAHIVDWLRQREPATPLAIIGYSLGGNALLKWLGEVGAATPVCAAAAISVPFVLDLTARRLGKGFSRLYQFHLLRELKRSYRDKFHWRSDGPVTLAGLAAIQDFYAFDDRITAPLHGYAGVHDYYTRASCRPYLKHIRVPTLILHALDDPFMYPEAVPETGELAPSVQLELSQNGGHVGFVSGRWPWQAEYWLEQRILAFLETQWVAQIPATASAEPAVPAALTN